MITNSFKSFSILLSIFIAAIIFIALTGAQSYAQQIGTFAVGSAPMGLVFDGTNIWVTNSTDNTVTKMRASDGANLGTFAVGASPRRVAYDGTNIWVSNWNGNSVTKLRASDGAFIQTLSMPQHPAGMTFDGANIWISNYDAGTVTKVRASDSSILGVFPAGNTPLSLTFDGANIWVANNQGAGRVTKIRAGDGSLIGSYPVQGFPGDITFDGSNIWVANTGNWTMTKLRASDGSEQGVFFVGPNEGGMFSDGSSIWITNESSLFRFRACDGTLIESFSGISIGQGVTYDGAHVWVANSGNNTITAFNFGPSSACQAGPAATPVTAASIQRWSVNNGFNTLSVFADGTLLAAGNTFAIGPGSGVKMNPRDGSTIASFPVPDVRTSVRLSTGDQDYVVGGYENRSAIRKDGTFARQLLGLGCCNIPRYPLALDQVNDIAYAQANGELFGANMSTGGLDRHFYGTGDSFGMISIADPNTLYATGQHGAVARMHPVNGTQWIVQLGDTPQQPGAVAQDASFVAVTGPAHFEQPTQPGRMARIRPDGSVAWNIMMNAVTPAVIGGNNLVFVGTQPSPINENGSGAIEAYDLNTGVLVWRTTVQGLPNDLLVGDDGAVYAGTGSLASGQVYVLDQNNGAIRRIITNVPGAWEIILRGGLLYASGNAITALPVEAVNYDPNSPWPVRFHDNQRTGNRQAPRLTAAREVAPGQSQTATFFAAKDNATTFEVFRYSVTATTAPVLQTTVTDASLSYPLGLTLSPQGELFVVNQGTAGGSVTRFSDPTSAFTFNGSIPAGPQPTFYGAFRGNELFVVERFNGVLRFKIDPNTGAVTPNGEIPITPTIGELRGVAVSPWGELFVSESSSRAAIVHRFIFDATDVAHPNGQFSDLNVGGIHGMAFSSWGELFTTSPSNNSIGRFTFDADRNVTFHGSITGGELNTPLDLSFAPWGELFVGNCFCQPIPVEPGSFPGIARFTFDDAHVATPNGAVTTPLPISGITFVPEYTVVPTPTPTPSPSPSPSPTPTNRFGDLPTRRPSDLFRWNPERELFVVDYGSGPGTPGGLLSSDTPGFCSTARGILGNSPVSFTLDSHLNPVANTDDLLALQSSLPDAYKWVGLALTSVCNGIHIEPPKVECPQMREFFIILTGESPEEMLIDELPLPPGSGLRDFLKQRFNICTGLDLSGLDCKQLIDLAAELAPLVTPGVGQFLNSPISKFVMKAIFCGLNIDIELPDIDVSFPDVDFGFGGGCWFGCDDDDDGGSSGGGGGGGGDNGSPGQPPYWFPASNGETVYDCSLVPTDWATMQWGELPSRAAAAGVSVPKFLNSIVACTSPYPIRGFPYNQITPYDDRSAFSNALCATSVTKTIDFTKHDDGTFITSPDADSYFETLTLSGVTFHRVQSYHNDFIYNLPGAPMRADLPPNTFAFGADLSSLSGTPGTYKITLSTGRTYSVVTNGDRRFFGERKFFGVISSTPIQWVSISYDNDYLVVDNFIIGSGCDSTPPVITPTVVGSLGNQGWYVGNVDVRWSITDAESSVSSSTGCDATTVTQDTSGITFTCSATSGGGTGTQSVTIKRDTTAPAVSCEAPDGQWHVTDVTIACNASDNLSSLSNAADASFNLSTNVAAGSETMNAATNSRNICDVAGNCATANSVGGNKVDKKAPVITVTAPTAGTYLLNQAVTVNYTCTDGGSGVTSCSGTTGNGGHLDTGNAGGKTFTVNSSDNVGNSAVQTTVNYRVSFGLAVLFDQTKANKSGSVVPIKFRLVDAGGANVSAAAIVVHAVNVVQIGSSASTVLEDPGASNPDFDFRFTTDSYQFNLKTTGYGTGTYVLNFTVGGDPTLYSVMFQVRQ